MPQVSKFEQLHVDILGPITKTNKGHQYILLFVDSYSRWAEAFPQNMDSKKIAKHYKEIFCRYRAPKIFV